MQTAAVERLNRMEVEIGHVAAATEQHA